MSSITLDKPDIALLSDIPGTRLEIDHLIMADAEESHDSATVWFGDGTEDSPALPVEYRGTGYSASLSCTARFVGIEAEHAACVAFVGLLRAARSAPDGRLQLRTNAGLVAGFDEAYVGTVPSWGKPRVLGQAYDVTFVLTLAAHTVEAP